jgi:uncharacterized membrane protein
MCTPLQGRIGMVRIAQSIEVERPIEEVFAFVTRFENLPRWEAGILEAGQLAPGPLGVGVRGRDVRQFLGRRTETTYEVTEHELPRRFAVRSLSGPVSVRASYTFEPVGAGTHVRSVAELALGGPVRLLAPLVTRVMQRQHAKDLRRLKAVLEAGRSADR